MSKSFRTPVVVSVTSKFLLCDMGELYDVLNYMTGSDLFTHQLPRAGDACTPALIEQHPKLASPEVAELLKGTDRTNWAIRCHKLIEILGPNLSVEPLKSFEAKNPITELAAAVGGDKVIVVL